MEGSKESTNAYGMENLMTSDEVAEMLHVEPVTIRRLINRGDLSAYRIGADFRISPSDLKEYLQRQHVPASATAEIGNDLFSQFIVWLRNVLREGPSDTAAFIGQERHRFDRFTERARKVLTLAQEEARNFKHNYVGTEHLILGLLDEGAGIAALALVNLGIEAEKVRQGVQIVIGLGDKTVEGEVGLTPRAKKTIELAVAEARSMQHHYIGTEHLLLGIMREGGGIGAQILVRLGATTEKVRQEVLRLLGERLGTPATEQEQEEPPSEASMPVELGKRLDDWEKGQASSETPTPPEEQAPPA
jgi:excisionase family DNA binding protein